ncbi:hypothetical protein OESDEN_03609 [Oesophagostomum dentatum]|uniref:DUF7636 domain-containing protein n=1 Tax=Oesophagostomum dentatum TaxID=61180 RepID=A0A0B1TLY7_OESDE|nr:hypothetical protein OESDEN_03609 [Oesophagostomum dentatum]
MRKTGVAGLSLRRLPGRQRRVAICARGSNQSLRLLRNLVIVKPVKAVNGAEETSALLPHLIYQNIMR